MSHTFIFLKKKTISVEVFLKTEKEFNKEILAMSKINEVKKWAVRPVVWSI